MELHFLGTGSCYPSPDRGASCTILRHDTGCWMFDCGEGTQIQLMKSTLKPGRINKIFITHLHGDHLFGLPGLLCTIGLNCAENKQPIEIYGPVGLRKYLRLSLELSQSLLGLSYSVTELQCFDSGPALPENGVEQAHSLPGSDSLHPNEIQGGTILANDKGVWQVCREGNLTVFAAPLKHRVTCFGFVIQEQQLPGKLDPNILKSKGIPPGPLYAKIKSGETITAPDGSLIKPIDVLGLPRPGRKVVILGDTCDSSRILDIAFDADVVVHEATLENELRAQCIDHGHSTPEMAGQFAGKIKAKKLVLTHFSQRYKKGSDIEENGTDDAVTVKKLLVQAKKAFLPGSVLVADDFMVIQIPQKHGK